MITMSNKMFKNPYIINTESTTPDKDSLKIGFTGLVLSFTMAVLGVNVMFEPFVPIGTEGYVGLMLFLASAGTSIITLGNMYMTHKHKIES